MAEKRKKDNIGLVWADPVSLWFEGESLPRAG